MAALVDAPKHAASIAPLQPLLPPAKYQEVLPAAAAAVLSPPTVCRQMLAAVRAMFMTAQLKDTFISAGERRACPACCGVRCVTSPPSQRAPSSARASSPKPSSNSYTRHQLTSRSCDRFRCARQAAPRVNLPVVTRQPQLLTRLHTDASRCGLNLAYLTHP